LEDGRGFQRDETYNAIEYLSAGVGHSLDKEYKIFGV
jgi:hypothetical protein